MPRRLRLPSFLICLALSALANYRLYAQEPLHADSATQPSPGHFIFKSQFSFTPLDPDSGPRQGEIRDLGMMATVQYGIERNLALVFRSRFFLRDRDLDFASDERDSGLGDIQLLGKWRFVQEDSTGLNTKRVALVVGTEIPSGNDPFTSDGVDAILGLTFTQIADRHGLNGDIKWKLTTEGAEDPGYAGMSLADLLTVNGAYLFRIAPKTYDSNTLGAWYAVLEINAFYETNADKEVFVSPGVMYEATRWVFEMGVQRAIYRDLDHRPTTDYRLVAGLRFLF